MPEHARLEIAVYGKGGIGKSTVSANLSVALAKTGRRVLQIGCDPKHDSTRLLMGGESLPTVLDYLRETPKEAQRLEAVLRRGACGVDCVEAGGPRPGVGCAGRGIITAFEFLERSHVKESRDIVVYDVLGDVVCGGFAVPIRREYADAIFLVTSGEFMALYAANNILRGVRNFDGDREKRVAGVILNARALDDEEAQVERFARAVGLPIVARVPRSEAFARAEAKKRTVMELGEDEAECAVFAALAERICGELPLYEARPLSDEELEAVVLGLAPTTQAAEARPEAAEAAAPEKAPLTEAARPDGKRPPLYGCAFNGAATTAIHLTDAVVIAHSPRTCAFYTWQNISSPGRKNLFSRGILMPSAISPNFECTEIGQAEAVFGGLDKLRQSVAAALSRSPGAVIVITSCVSGIIGDDARSLEAMGTADCPVIVLEADGDINGDYMQGIELCLHSLAERLIDRKAPPRDKCVNVIGETGVMNNLDVNFRTIRDLLGAMGVAVNCRFLGDATAAELRNLLAAPLNILASDGADNRALQGWLEDSYGCRFFEGCLPVGFRETASFLERIGDFFGCAGAVRPIVEAEERRFEEELALLRPKLAGKRLLLTTINANMDWLLDTARAVGMELGWIGVLNYLHRDMTVTAHPEDYPMIEEIADWRVVMERIGAVKPDIVLSNYTSAVPPGDYVLDNVPMNPRVGFQAGVHVLKHWTLLLEEKAEGGWANDRALFEKHFA